MLIYVDDGTDDKINMDMEDEKLEENGVDVV